MLRLYELSGKEDRRFSPFCWRARLALAHKGVVSENVPVKYTDKTLIAFSGQDRVPVLVDDGVCIHDSWAIACHLEEKYHSAPTLFGGGTGRHLTRFIDNWATRSLFPHVVRLVLCDAIHHLDAEDANYVKRTREKQLGVSLETLEKARPENVIPFRESLTPLRSYVRQNAYFGGLAPSYADYCVFSVFQWARMISPFRLIDDDDPIHAWRSRMLDLFNGLAESVPHYDC